jgi:hypothetical protein
MRRLIGWSAPIAIWGFGGAFGGDRRSACLGPDGSSSNVAAPLLLRTRSEDSEGSECAASNFSGALNDIIVWRYVGIDVKCYRRPTAREPGGGEVAKSAASGMEFEEAAV